MTLLPSLPFRYKSSFLLKRKFFNNYVNWEMPVYFLFRTKIWKFISFVILICSVPAKSENLDSTLKDH